MKSKLYVVALVAAVALLPTMGIANSRMAMVKLPKCSEWKLPSIDASAKVEATWHEADESGNWYTNSVGEKNSLSEYCAGLYAATQDAVVPRLDKAYRRCPPQTIRKLYDEEIAEKGSFWKEHYTCGADGKLLKGLQSSQVELTAWKLCNDIYLLLAADDTGRMRIRTYEFVLFDGKTRRTIAEFDYMPPPDRVSAILSVKSNPDAVNNVAAMYYNEEAWTHSVDNDYVVRLLALAARLGSATACENFAVLGKDRGWAKERIEGWRKYAEVCRQGAKTGCAPKGGLESVAKWPKSWVDK